MTTPTDANLMSFLKGLASPNENKSENKAPPRPKDAYPYSVVEVQQKRNRGTFAGVILTDVNKIPVRQINDMWEGMIPVTPGTFKGAWNIRVCCNPKSYPRGLLTESDKELLKELDEALTAYDNNNKGGKFNTSSIRKYPVTYIYYMGVKQFIPCGADTDMSEYEAVVPTLMLTHQRSFLERLTAAAEARKTKTKGKFDLRNYIVSEPTENCGLVNVEHMLANGKQWMVQVSFDSSDVEVTQELLDMCEDLNTKVVNMVEFNRDRYEKILDFVNKKNGADRPGVIASVSSASKGSRNANMNDIDEGDIEDISISGSSFVDDASDDEDLDFNSLT